MKLYQHLQVNSNFFYANTLNLSKFDNYVKTKIKIKKYSQQHFDTLIESLVFSEQKLYVFIKTKDKGEFLLSNIDSNISKDEAIEYLKLNSANQTAYLFDNVDYFAYGRFAVANNGKIERYLSFNSEPRDDENIVEWIGKPHKWEYETHKFFTKKKLEDFEMIFDSDTVCEMVEYYLPFINEDLDIKELIVFSKENINYYNPYKTQKISLNRENLTKIYKKYKEYDIDMTCITINSNNNGLILSDYYMCLLTASNPISPIDKILSSNTMHELHISENDFKKKLLNYLTEMIIDISNVKEKFLINIRDNLLDIDIRMSDSNVFYIFFEMKKPNRFQLYLTSKQEKHKKSYNLGNKLNLKMVDKILKLIGFNIIE